MVVVSVPAWDQARALSGGGGAARAARAARWPAPPPAGRGELAHPHHAFHSEPPPGGPPGCRQPLWPLRPDCPWSVCRLLQPPGARSGWPSEASVRGAARKLSGARWKERSRELPLRHVRTGAGCADGPHDAQARASALGMAPGALVWMGGGSDSWRRPLGTGAVAGPMPQQQGVCPALLELRSHLVSVVWRAIQHAAGRNQAVVAFRGPTSAASMALALGRRAIVRWLPAHASYAAHVQLAEAVWCWHDVDMPGRARGCCVLSVCLAVCVHLFGSFSRATAQPHLGGLACASAARAGRKRVGRALGGPSQHAAAAPLHALTYAQQGLPAFDLCFRTSYPPPAPSTKPVQGGRPCSVSLRRASHARRFPCRQRRGLARLWGPPTLRTAGTRRSAAAGQAALARLLAATKQPA